MRGKHVKIWMSHLDHPLLSAAFTYAAWAHLSAAWLGVHEADARRRWREFFGVCVDLRHDARLGLLFNLKETQKRNAIGIVEYMSSGEMQEVASIKVASAEGKKSTETGDASFGLARLGMANRKLAYSTQDSHAVSFGKRLARDEYGRRVVKVGFK